MITNNKKDMEFIECQLHYIDFSRFSLYNKAKCQMLHIRTHIDSNTVIVTHTLGFTKPNLSYRIINRH